MLLAYQSHRFEMVGIGTVRMAFYKLLNIR
jgi:hypothetical protein